MKKSLSFILALAMIFTCVPPLAMSAFALPSSDVPEGYVLTSSTSYNVAPGITEEHIVTVDQSGNNQNQSYVGIIDFSTGKVGAMAGYKDYSTNGQWGMQTVRDQAAAAAAATGRNIVLGINADYFNMSTGEPTNQLVMGGKVVKASGSGYYFAILKDGTPVIRFNNEPLDDVKEAVGSPFYLILNGEVNPGIYGDTAQMPRNAIGIREDGKVVVMVNDGRQAPKSVGYTLWQIAEMMKAYGCVDCLYLDGGGSATFISKSEGEDAITVKNSPSDGTERLVSDTLFFYSTAAPTGEFDHAVLSPNNEVYTPYSTVQFTATGVDISGAKVALPEGVAFALADDTFGTISADGTFVSNGKTGIVEVKLNSGSETVGSVSIEIAAPDSISFVNEEIALAFEESNTLGLTVKNNNRTINYNDGDFVWEVVSTSEGVEAAALGAFGVCENGSGQTNTFTASESVSGNGVVTAKYYYDQSVSGSINLVIGKAPTIVMDFENHEDEDGNVISAEDYWTFGRAAVNANGGDIRAYWDRNRELKWYVGQGELVPTETCITAHYYNGDDPFNSRGGEESAELVSLADDEELVRKGNNSLKINYDFSNINGIEGACVGFSDPNMVIPGTPTGIGMWVYCPEGTPNLWLRIRFKDKAGVVQTLNYNPMGQKNVPFDDYIGHNVDELITYNNNSNEEVTTTIQEALGGFNWTGWKYVECDITGVQGPFTLLGGETVRVMHTYAAYGGMGNFYVQDGKLQKLEPSERKGYIVIDDVQFVYGSNTEDTDNPVVNSVSADNALLNDGAVLTGNTHSFTASFSDVQNRYTSGLNYDTVNAWVDGISVPQNDIYTDASKDEAYIYDYYLAEGAHTIKFMIKDKNDNKAILTKRFVVEKGDGVYPTLNVDLKNEKLYLNDNAEITVSTTDRAQTDAIEATFNLGSAYTEYEVVYADGYQEKAAPVYNAQANSVVVSAEKIPGSKVGGQGEIATLKVKIPVGLPAGAKFTYSASKLIYKAYDNNGTEKTLSFVKLAENFDVFANYTIVFETMIEGQTAVVKVVDEAGAPAAGVTVYKADGAVLGVTDENGAITTDAFKAVENVSIYAKDANDKYSFITTAQSYTAGANADGTPTFIKVNPSANSETAKNVTWLSNPIASAKAAVVQYALKADYDANGEAAFATANGTSEYLVFNGSAIVTENTAVYSNAVVLEGLKRGSEYVYRVGDGAIWSDLLTFRTLVNGQDTSFFIVGDTQAEDTTVIETIANAIAEAGFDFGVQTGDFVEKTTLYSNWTNILGAFDGENFKAIDTVHVTGNHELFGDEEGLISGSIFNVENRLHYSATYGNVYVAVLGYSDNETELQETAQWLKDDAAKSNAIWKIVVSHQPVYGTNEASTDCDLFRAYISEACDEAGIDFAFAGHDHSYARTYPIYNGEKTEGEGTVYFVCASTGEKSYTPSNNRNFPFVLYTNEGYTGIYLTITATADTFEIITRDYDGSIFDTYTKTKVICENGIHSYIYNSDGYLTCSKCGHCEAAGTYTGKVHAETGELMFLANGEVKHDTWQMDGDNYYYLGSDGKAVTGKQTIDGIEYTFDENGVNIAGSFVKETVVNPDSGASTEITRYYLGGQYVRNWREIDGDLYYFRFTNSGVRYNEGAMYTGVRSITTPGKNTTRRFTFADDGRLLVGALEDEFNTDGTYKGTRYYWGDQYLTDTTVEIDGFKYDLDSNGYVTNELIPIEDCTIKLSSTAYSYTGTARKPSVTVKHGDDTLNRYQHYDFTYANNVAIGTATVTVTGIHGVSGEKKVTYKVVPARPTGLTAVSNSTGTVSLAWNAVEFATGYEIQRRTADTSFKKVGTTAGEIAFTDKDLVIGQEYIYAVRAIDTIDGVDYASGRSEEATAKPIINGATAYYAIANAYNTITVNWAVTEHATAYKVYRSTESEGGYKLIATVTGTSYKDKTADVASPYFYKIVPNVTNSAGSTDGAASFIISAKTTLDDVTGVKAKATSYNKIDVTWNKVAGATGYVVYRHDTAKNKYVKIADVTTTSFTNKSLLTNKKYYYKIKAYRTVDGKKYYGSISATAAATPRLDLVTGLKAESASYNSIKLTWKEVAGATGYDVYRYSAKAGKYVKYASVNTNSYTNKKLTTGKKYYYRVKPFRTVDENNRYGSLCKSVAARPKLGKVTGVKAASKSATEIKLTWTKVPGATGYLVYRSTAKTGTYKQIGKATSNTYVNAKVKTGTAYFYKVRAYIKLDSATRYGAYSAVVSGKAAK